MRGVRVRVAVGLAVLAGAGGTLAVGCSPALAGSNYVYGAVAPTLLEGPSLGSGPLVESTGVAINEVAAGSVGDVYVVNKGKGVVERFDAAGAYLGEFDTAGGLSSEEEKGEKPVADPFSGPNWIAADDSASASDASRGDVYVVNAGAGKIEKFGPQGEALGVSLPEPPEYTYVNSTGEEETLPPGFLTEEESSEILVRGIAVDGNGDVWVANRGIADEYDSSGAFQLGWRMGFYSAHEGFGVDGSGHVYLSGKGLFEKLLLRYSDAGVQEANLSGTCTEECTSGLAVDEGTGELFVARGPNSETGSAIEIAPETSAGVELQAPFGAGELQGAGGLAFDAQTHQLYVSDPTAGNVKVFQGEIPATIALENPSGEQPSSAMVSGTIDPNGGGTVTCMVEYGEEASYGQSIPCSPASIPSGESAVPVTAQLTGLTPGQSYHYRFVAKNALTIDSPDQSFRLAPPPLVDAQAGFATNVSDTSAALNGTVDPYGNPASYHFEYGTTTAYGSVVPTPDLYTPVNDEEDTLAPLTITGLQPGTTYHFALVVTSPGGTVTGPDETFTTASIPLPGASTGGVFGVSEGAVTLTGSVNPEGTDASYQFQYGTSTAYGASWPTIPVQDGAFTGFQPVTIYLQNLQPDTTYHYRLLATNAAGTAYGADQTFTTTSYPVSIVREVPGAALALGPPAKSTGPGKSSKPKKKGPKRHRRARSKKKAKPGRRARRLPFMPSSRLTSGCIGCFLAQALRA